jgi:hypothetical protein
MIKRIINWLFGRSAKPTKHYDRLFFYWEGRLDTEAESVEIEYVDDFPGGMSPPFKSIQFNIARNVASQDDELTGRVKTAWIKGQTIKVAAMFGGSGKIVKTEGVVTAMKIWNKEPDTAKMTYSVRCPAVDFV